MSRIMLIGGAGLLGSHLEPILREAGHDVGILDNFSGTFSYRKKDRRNVFSGDATEKTVVRSCLDKFDPDTLFIAIDHTFSLDELGYRPHADVTTILGSTNAICAYLNPRIKRVFFCSSSEVYGGPDAKKPIKEDRKITQSSSQHGIAKLASEKLLEFRCQELGIPLTIMRFFNIYGPRLKFTHKNGIISFMIHTLLHEEEVLGVTDAKAKRDFIHVDDAAIASYKLIESDFEGIVNVGSGVPVTLGQASKELTRQIQPHYKPVLLGRGKRPNYSAVADTSILESLGWSPKRDIWEELETLIRFRKGEIDLYKDSKRVLELMRS